MSLRTSNRLLSSSCDACCFQVVVACIEEGVFVSDRILLTFWVLTASMSMLTLRLILFVKSAALALTCLIFASLPSYVRLESIIDWMTPFFFYTFAYSYLSLVFSLTNFSSMSCTVTSSRVFSRNRFWLRELTSMQSRISLMSLRPIKTDQLLSLSPVQVFGRGYGGKIKTYFLNCC